MAKTNPKLKATKPKNIFKAATNGSSIQHFPKALVILPVANEIGTDTVEALSAIGIATEPGELAFLLIRRSITKALFDLVGESAGQQLPEANKDAGALVEQLNFSLSVRDVQIDRKFLDRPAELPLIAELQSILRQWLEGLGVSMPTAGAICDRLPSYFVYALNQEWRMGMDRLFSSSKAPNPRREIFDEPFSLSQMYEFR